jgi:hypothetical protein
VCYRLVCLSDSNAVGKMEIRLGKAQIIKAIDDGDVSMYFRRELSSPQQSQCHVAATSHVAEVSHIDNCIGNGNDNGNGKCIGVGIDIGGKSGDFDEYI